MQMAHSQESTRMHSLVWLIICLLETPCPNRKQKATEWLRLQPSNKTWTRCSNSSMAWCTKIWWANSLRCSNNIRCSVQIHSSKIWIASGTQVQLWWMLTLSKTKSIQRRSILLRPSNRWTRWVATNSISHGSTEAWWWIGLQCTRHQSNTSQSSKNPNNKISPSNKPLPIWLTYSKIQPTQSIEIVNSYSFWTNWIRERSKLMVKHWLKIRRRCRSFRSLRLCVSQRKLKDKSKTKHSASNKKNTSQSWEM